MQYDKKVRFGGYNHPDYKLVREKLDRLWRSEFENEIDEQEQDSTVVE